MSKFSIIILLCALVASNGQTSDITEYCQALAGELAACKQYLVECEAQRKDFAMRSEDREHAIAAENAKLKVELERLQKQKQSLLAEKAKLSEEQQQLHESREACLKTLNPAEQALEARRQQLPQVLAETMLPPLANDNPAARLHRFLESIESIRDFDQQLQKPVPTILTGPDGIQREFQLLYLGLSTAYAVAPEAKIAGFGIRQNGDWEWHWQQDYFPDIAHAINISSGKRPPTLLILPVTIIKGDGQ